jgi:L-amino acid N-acyltransferase YncA
MTEDRPMLSQELMIRAARDWDLPGLLAIYNVVIASSVAVFSIEPSTLQERAAWLATRTERGFPVIVAEIEGEVAGFASFGEFRGVWPGYRHSVEHSVHVRNDWRGRGIGTRLTSALFPLATAMGKHVMIGGIDADNEVSLRMHERLGFQRVAHLHEVGRKFGRWLDLVLMQRYLDEPGAARED